MGAASAGFPGALPAKRHRGEASGRIAFVPHANLRALVSTLRLRWNRLQCIAFVTSWRFERLMALLDYTL